MTPDCFKAYDVRGVVGTDLDTRLAHRIGRAFARATGARAVVLGQDNRASSPALADAVAAGLMAEGAAVHDLGLCGTEEVYFATDHLGACGGVMVTASHNPADQNGMKMVGRGAAPLAPDAFAAIRALARAADPGPPRPGGSRSGRAAVRTAYVARVLSFLDPDGLHPLTILVDAGHGAAGPTFDAIAEGLLARGVPWRFVRRNHAPDPAFPNGVPNPMLPANRPPTGRAVRAAGADLGVAWDGDFDRCFLWDHRGRFAAGEHVVALLAGAFLSRAPGGVIVHDPRALWCVADAVAAGGGRSVLARTGHAHMKRAMRDSGAVYGGELSAHHYFRDFMACDSGMIPWILVAGLLARQGARLAALIDDRRARFPSSGEINFRPSDPEAAIARVRDALGPLALARDDTDGLSLAFAGWRLNLRRSGTEALLRLNVEARGDAALVRRGVARATALIAG